MPLDNLVTIRNLHFKRGNHIIFNGINLDIPRGKITAILGPSGTGKTTLLRLIGAQLIPQQGFINVEGENIHQLNRSALLKARQQMGLLFQSGALFTNLSVFENVAFPLREHTTLSESMITTLTLMKLHIVGLRGAKDLYTNELSGGMARRVALARAIALDPKLIMYDEPFTGLDPISLAVILQLIKRLNDALKMTTILVSHDVAETIRIADKIYVISDGKILGQGSPMEIQANQSPEIRQFIHGLSDGTIPFHYPAPAYIEELLK
ncbi:MAG: Intermembrane phospholipid transport system ATP-binding protein MlaF [Legionellaceae bacterium]